MRGWRRSIGSPTPSPRPAVDGARHILQRQDRRPPCGGGRPERLLGQRGHVPRVGSDLARPDDGGARDQPTAPRVQDRRRSAIDRAAAYCAAGVDDGGRLSATFAAFGVALMLLMAGEHSHQRPARRGRRGSSCVKSHSVLGGEPFVCYEIQCCSVPGRVGRSVRGHKTAPSEVK